MNFEKKFNQLIKLIFIKINVLKYATTVIKVYRKSI